MIIKHNISVSPYGETENFSLAIWRDWNVKFDHDIIIRMKAGVENSKCQIVIVLHYIKYIYDIYPRSSCSPPDEVLGWAAPAESAVSNLADPLDPLNPVVQDSVVHPSHPPHPGVHHTAPLGSSQTPTINSVPLTPHHGPTLHNQLHPAPLSSCMNKHLTVTCAPHALWSCG